MPESGARYVLWNPARGIDRDLGEDALAALAVRLLAEAHPSPLACGALVRVLPNGSWRTLLTWDPRGNAEIGPERIGDSWPPVTHARE